MQHCSVLLKIGSALHSKRSYCSHRRHSINISDVFWKRQWTRELQFGRPPISCTEWVQQWKTPWHRSFLLALSLCTITHSCRRPRRWSRRDLRDSCDTLRSRCRQFGRTFMRPVKYELNDRASTLWRCNHVMAVMVGASMVQLMYVHLSTVSTHTHTHDNSDL